MKDSIATFVVFTISGLFSLVNSNINVKQVDINKDVLLIDSLNKKVDVLKDQNNQSIDSIKLKNNKLNGNLNKTLKEIDSLRFESENHEYPIIYTIKNEKNNN